MGTPGVAPPQCVAQGSLLLRAELSALVRVGRTQATKMALETLVLLRTRSDRSPAGQPKEEEQACLAPVQE